MAQTNQVKSIVKYRENYQVSNFLIEQVKLKVELFEGYSLVSSELLVVTNSAASRGSVDRTLCLDGENLGLLSLALDGKALSSADYELDEQSLRIANFPERAVLSSQVKIYPEKNTSLEGLYQSSGKYCTQCEAEGFRKITYYLDRPDVMAIFEVRIEADKENFPYLLSNGNKVAAGELADNRHYATWQDPFKKPSYLFALCAGNYDLLEDKFITQSGREVLLQIFVDTGKLSQCQHAMDSLKKSMLWDEKVFGLEYDLDIYMIVAVGDFNMGAMENKGLNVFNTKYVLAAQETATDQDFEDVEAVIGHEYFHNWTGNRVTCRDWFQLSLKEGLTVFRDQQFTADQTDAAVKRISDVKLIRAHQFAEDAGPMAHPIRPDSYIEMNNFYTVTIYNKGAEVIRMYHTLLGADGFRQGMDLYFKRHDGQAVTCEDFVSAMEDANDYPLTQFRRWYSQAGTPLVVVSSDYDQAEQRLSLTITQSCPPTPGQTEKEPFHIPMRMALLDPQGNSMQLDLADKGADLQDDILHLRQQQQEFVFINVPHKPVLSLLRNFSAPVKLEYDYSDQELAFLYGHDSDPFNRWDAGQRLLTNVIWDLYQDSKSAKALFLPQHLIDAVKSILDSNELDGQFKALALSLPSIKTLIETVEQLDIDHLLAAHKFVKQSLAKALELDWLLHYQTSHHIGDFGQDKESIAKRALSNICLDYLVSLEKPQSYQLAQKQLVTANNMTDAISAFSLLSHSNSPSKTELAESFYQQWQDEDLVLDKWLAVQASDPNDETIAKLTNLTEHPAYQSTNPNKVRALIGTFAGANMAQFHRLDGRGYELLAEQIQSLYAVNPQIAARLTGAFNRWKKFDSKRQQLMKTQLQSILALPDLSRDVFEIASKALK